MTYHNFTLETVKDQFKLNLLDAPFCEFLPTADPQPAFLTIFQQWFRLAETAQSAKAKSELLVSPILAEVVQLTQQRVQLFSGQELNVDIDCGLDGVVDFLLSKSTTRYLIKAPIIMLVEADKEGLDLGWGQCVAQMIAAQKFNASKGNEISVIYGSVTNGKSWQFLKLEGKNVTIDRHQYYVTPVERILGILKWMVEQQD
ncbi:hypothetical protein [Chamaesiphon sp.]|uniref:hypothetical protein n=1 Tax=Chamaesiphon sp. TaxID=2814140 RepID=UPI003593010C